MTELDLYADENKPTAELKYRVYKVTLPKDAQSQYKTSELPSIYVEVDDLGVVQLSDYSWWFGTSVRDLDHKVRMEVFEWLTEWELAEWRRIGPEDSELFATWKLCPEWGLE